MIYNREWFESKSILPDHADIKQNQSMAWFFTADNLMILVSEDQVTYGFPGGGIEKGENAFEALEREILEELGLSKNDYNYEMFGYYLITEYDDSDEEMKNPIGKFIQARFLARTKFSSTNLPFNPKTDMGENVVVYIAIQLKDVGKYFVWVENSSEYLYLNAKKIF